MIALDAVTARYGVTQPCTVRVEGGEMVAVIGANGAGKTTLLRLLTGHLDPSSGQAVVESQALQQMPPRARARQLAYLPQFEARPEGFTVSEFVMLGRYAHRSHFGGQDADGVTTVASALETLAISPWSERDISELSGGEYQRVRIARAIAQGSPILVLDEPVAHLDLAGGQQLLRTVRAMNRLSGLTVVAALHDLNLASLFFDRVLLLNQGEIIADGAPSEVITPPNLASAFQDSFSHLDHPSESRPQVLPISGGKNT